VTDRRRAVPFDPDYFARRAAAGESLSAAEAFRHALRTNHWAGAESSSGPGSGLDQTRALRTALPALFRRRGISSLLDLPCGDWRWMARVDLGGLGYTGGDLLEELVAQNQKRYGGPSRHFVQLDLTVSDLPGADLLLCRDCLVHLSFADIARAFRNISRSGIALLLTTTFPAQSVNTDIVTGDWRPLNLQEPPFNLPAPAEVINEGCTEGDGVFADKSLGLWRLEDLPR
jgi:SAM-dependent methyltransferase